MDSSNELKRSSLESATSSDATGESLAPGKSGSKLKLGFASRGKRLQKNPQIALPDDNPAPSAAKTAAKEEPTLQGEPGVKASKLAVFTFRKRTKSTPAPRPTFLAADIPPLPTRVSLPIAARFARADRASWIGAYGVPPQFGPSTTEFLPIPGNDVRAASAPSSRPTTPQPPQQASSVLRADTPITDEPVMPTVGLSVPIIAVDNAAPAELSAPQPTMRSVSPPTVTTTPTVAPAKLPSTAKQLPRMAPSPPVIAIRHPLVAAPKPAPTGPLPTPPSPPMLSPEAAKAPSPTADAQSPLDGQTTPPAETSPPARQPMRRGRESPFPVKPVRPALARAAPPPAQNFVRGRGRVGFYLPSPSMDDLRRSMALSMVDADAASLYPSPTTEDESARRRAHLLRNVEEILVQQARPAVMTN